MVQTDSTSSPTEHNTQSREDRKGNFALGSDWGLIKTNCLRLISGRSRLMCRDNSKARERQTTTHRTDKRETGQENPQQLNCGYESSPIRSKFLCFCFLLQFWISSTTNINYINFQTHFQFRWHKGHTKQSPNVSLDRGWTWLKTVIIGTEMLGSPGSLQRSNHGFTEATTRFLSLC